MILPTALVIGPMKAGTTWIHDYLEWRGDVRLPRGVKETFFFDKKWNKGAIWYAKHFSASNERDWPVTVEVAPSLFHDPYAPDHVRDTLGQVPLIVTVRDPVKRAWSHYQHLRRKGYTNSDLNTALGQFPEIVEASQYEKQISRWRECMPDAPITVLKLEDLSADPEVYTKQLCAAFGLPYRRPSPDLGQSNASGVPPSFLLAKLGRHAATVLRAARGYMIINTAKQLGLKRLVFGKDGAFTNAPTPEECDLLLRELAHAGDRQK